jgi:hypothetical protein
LADGKISTKGAKEIATALHANTSLTDGYFSGIIDDEETYEQIFEQLGKNKNHRAKTAVHILVATRVVLLPHARNRVCDDGLAILPVEIWEMIVMHVGDGLPFAVKKKIYTHAMDEKTLEPEDKNTFLCECVGIKRIDVAKH